MNFGPLQKNNTLPKLLGSIQAQILVFNQWESIPFLIRKQNLRVKQRRAGRLSFLHGDRIDSL
jgi:hypothetical protein